MPCPICNSAVNPRGPARSPDGREGYFVNCERCGPYYLSEEAMADMNGWHRRDEEKIARIGHAVRRMARPGRHPFLMNDALERLVNEPLPSVFEQADNLIRWLGENATGPGESVTITPASHQFIVGAKRTSGVDFLLEHLLDTGLLKGDRVMGGANAELSFAGWEHFDRIQRGAVDSHKAFMAMQYGDDRLDGVVRDVFAPAVAQTGFQLVRLDDQPKAGLIDDRLRVEIRACRFLIADLSHGNKGAYWEAGFAEGLGKPVIYTCERKVFEEEQSHFDTNHHLTVMWDVDDLQPAAELLKAAIRATLPAEAKLTDE